VPADILTADKILDTAEDVLRRYGPAKATVLDVARALGVSHGSVYRHFPSKTALRDAVAQRWLARVSTPLHQIAAAPGPAEERLRRHITELSHAKRRMAAQDPELFATFHQIATESRAIVGEHLDTLAGQLSTIIGDGVGRGEFVKVDAHRYGRAVLQATVRFHHPAHAGEWDDPVLDGDLDAVLEVLLGGLRARTGVRKSISTKRRPKEDQRSTGRASRLR
jgi:AcrR family transcriptional regulator